MVFLQNSIQFWFSYLFDVLTSNLKMLNATMRIHANNYKGQTSFGWISSVQIVSKIHFNQIYTSNHSPAKLVHFRLNQNPIPSRLDGCQQKVTRTMVMMMNCNKMKCPSVSQSAIAKCSGKQCCLSQFTFTVTDRLTRRRHRGGYENQNHSPKAPIPIVCCGMKDKCKFFQCYLQVGYQLFCI